MNILIDIGHPAHVHNYRNLAVELQQRGHRVIWTVKDIKVAQSLLRHYGFNFIVLPPKSDSLIGKIINQLHYDLILYRICKREKIDIAIGSSATVAHVSAVSKTKSIVFDDDDDSVQPLVAKLVKPFVNSVLSPSAINDKRSSTVKYSGYHELAYLHPNRFVPNLAVLSEVGIAMGEPYFIMRFNVFKAHHDIGVKGLSLNQKLRLVEVLKPHGKIFITTERDIEPELKQYQLAIAPENIHSFMAYSSMFLGDSQTMTQEAAELGVPALKCNSFAGRLSVPNELESKYGLIFSYLPEDFDSMLQKLNELLAMSNLKEEWQQRRQRMLNDKIDVTAFWVWFVENYPKSVGVMKENSDYQFGFR
jgi:uncharacterized protein